MLDQPRSKLPPGEYVVLGGDAPDHKVASFRLRGDALDPDVVTSATGLTPYRAHRKGDRRPSNDQRCEAGRAELAPWRSGLWSLNSESALPRTDNHLEDHLNWLLDQLEPVAETLKQFCADDALTADFFCGYFMHHRTAASSSARGPSRAWWRLMRRLESTSTAQNRTTKTAPRSFKPTRSHVAALCEKGQRLTSGLRSC